MDSALQGLMTAAANVIKDKGHILKRVRTQKLDVSQAQKLQTALGHLRLVPRLPVFQDGDTLPAGYHFVYFTPHDIVETNLGPDGSDISFNPTGTTFTRRMWAGGKLSYNAGNPLRLGDLVTERTSLSNVQCKTTATGQPMLVVSAEKVLSNTGGICLEERRDWLFRQPSKSTASFPNARDAGATSEKDISSINSVALSSTLLFRYSALTYNAHRIHLDRNWCRAQEGHRDLVVHGPLLLTLMAQVGAGRKRSLQSIEYRAKSPCYVNEAITIQHKDDQILCKNQQGQTVMQAVVEFA